MTGDVLVGLCAAALLLTTVLAVWRRSQRSVVQIIAVQGVALAALVAVLGAAHWDAETLVVVLLVLALKGVLLPWVLARRLAWIRGAGAAIDGDAALLNPTATVGAAAALGVLAYATTWPLVGASHELAVRLAPVGVAMVLIGFLALATRRLAISQLVGFLLLDNGIATVAFLISGGVPVLIEFATSFDLFLVIAILEVFTVRMHAAFGDTDVQRLRELRD